MFEKKPATILLWVSLFLSSTFFPVVIAQNRSGAEVVVIEGATIINGTGNGSQEGWIIVLGDGRIQDVGPAGQVRRPDGARVIDAKGKFIIPGLTDTHVHYYGYEAELFLAHGVTSALLLGGVYEWEIAQREAIARGEIIGPRIFTAGYTLGGPISTPPAGTTSTGPAVGLASLPHSISVHNSREEAITATRRLIEQDVDFIKIQAEITPALAKVISDEAHKAGKRVVGHLGSYFDAREGAMAGVDMLAHGNGISRATTPPALRKRAEQLSYLRVVGPASLMQPVLFEDLIRILIEEDVYIEPDLHYRAKGVHPLSAKFALDYQRLLSDVDLSYVSDNSLRRWFTLPLYTTGGNNEGREELLRKGYENLVLFYRQFVEAGGKLLAGTDTESGVPPGISLHHELELLVHERILSPEQAIISATRLPAEFLDRSEDLGTLEKGKIADMVILNRDPLQDIGNTQDIYAVFKDGQPVDLDYHRYFTSPLPRPTWTAIGTPTPHIESFPLSVSCSDSTADVTIKGKNFRPQSFVRIDGVGQDIKYVSPTEITTELDCQNLDIPGTYVLTVVNPRPIQFNESAVSNPAKFVVTR
jgi:imidazolonepropionase-like amidohydrolase